MKEDGDLAYQIKQLIRKYIEDGGKDAIPLYEENGVYTGYVDRGGTGEGYTGTEPVPAEFRPGGKAELCLLRDDPACTGRRRNPMLWQERGPGVPHRQAWP